jgi:hypothetical protein
LGLGRFGRGRRGPFTVKSFAELLRSAETLGGADILESLLTEDRAAANVIEGLRRSVIAKMAPDKVFCSQ